MKTFTMDKSGGTTANSIHGGLIRMEIWTSERERHEDPYVVTMTPGQALSLIQCLSGSARVAIMEMLK